MDTEMQADASIAQTPRPPSWLLDEVDVLAYQMDPDRRLAAVRSLHEKMSEIEIHASFFAGALAVAVVRDSYVAVRREAIETLQAMGNFAIQYMDSMEAALTKDAAPSVRSAAAAAIGKFGSAAAQQAAFLRAAAVNDCDGGVRGACAAALARVGAADEQRAIATLLHEHADPVMRFRAAEALGHFVATLEMSEVLTKATLNDKSVGVRQAAAKALAKQGASATTELSAELLHSDDNQKRRSAAQGLGVLLANLRKDAHRTGTFESTFDIFLRDNTGTSKLGMETDDVDGKSLLVMEVKPKGLVVEWNTNHPDKKVRPGHQVIAVNGHSGDSLKLIELLKRGGHLQVTLGRDVAMQHSGALRMSAIEDDDASVRLWSRTALSNLGPVAAPYAWEFAESALRARDATERLHAAEALCAFEGSLRDQQVERLASALKAKDPRVQCNAADALKEFGTAANPHRPALLATARNVLVRPEVRAAASRAVRALGPMRKQSCY